MEQYLQGLVNHLRRRYDVEDDENQRVCTLFFLCLQCDSADTRLTFQATGSERKTRPKGFDERINVYP